MSESSFFPGYAQGSGALLPEETYQPTTGPLENFAAVSESQVQVDNAGAERRALAAAYDPILQQLNGARDLVSGGYANPYGYSPSDAGRRGLDRDEIGADGLAGRIWNEVARRRHEGEPLDGIPVSRDDLEKEVHDSARAAAHDALRVGAQASFLGKVGGLAGGLVGGFMDPDNLALNVVPIGRVVGFARQVLANTIMGGVGGVLTHPERTAYREKLGLDTTTLGEDVLGGAEFGAAFGAGGYALHHLAPPLVKAAWRKVLGRDPATAGEARAATDQLSRRELVDLAKETAPEPTPVQRDAINTLEAQLASEEENPFDPADLDEHERRQMDAIEAILSGRVPEEPPAAAAEPGGEQGQGQAPRVDPPLAPKPSALPAGVESFAPDELTVDAERFQFKSGGDASGVTDRLQGVTTWDPVKAGMTLVWQDEDGRHFVADGHQRVGLARRIAEADPAQQPRVNAIVLRASDGITAADARSAAAFKNIAEGTGTAIDAAKIFRASPDRVNELPPRSELVRQGQQLAKLSEPAFNMAVNGVVPERYAALVGRLVEDESLHAPILGVLTRAEPENLTQAEAIVRQAREAGAQTYTQDSLFGEETVVASLYRERSRVLDAGLKMLRRDRRVFATLTGEAATIEGAGNTLDPTANAARKESDERALAVIQALANRTGPLSDALNAGARAYAGNGRLADAARSFVAAVRNAAERGDLIPGSDAARGPDGAGPIPGDDAAGLSAGGDGSLVEAGGAGGAGAPGEAAAQGVEPEPAFLLDEPGGSAAKAQVEELTTEAEAEPGFDFLEGRQAALAEPPAEPFQAEAEAERADLKALVDRGASEEEILAHPAIETALAAMESIPITSKAPGYGSPQWRRSRLFDFAGERVRGYPAAIKRLIAGARAFSTDGPVRRERRAVIVLGPPAAGKSTVAEGLARRLFAAIVDPDEAKKVLPEFRGGIGANAVHDESAALADQVYGRLLDTGDNLVLPKVGGKSATIAKLIGDLKAAGYRVDLVNMAVSYDNAFRRMVGRFLKTGRLINPAYVREVGEAPSATYMSLRDKGVADGYAELDNNGAGPALREQRDTDLYQEGPSPELSGDGGDRGAGAGAWEDRAAGFETAVRPEPGELGRGERATAGDDRASAAGEPGLGDDRTDPALREQRDTDLYQEGPSPELSGDGGDRGAGAGGGRGQDAGAESPVRPEPGQLGRGERATAGDDRAGAPGEPGLDQPSPAAKPGLEEPGAVFDQPASGDAGSDTAGRPSGDGRGRQSDIFPGTAEPPSRRRAAPLPLGTERGVEGLPQGIFPGMERSSAQGMAARNAAGGIRGRNPGAPLTDGLFADRTDEGATGALFEPPTAAFRAGPSVDPAITLTDRLYRLEAAYAAHPFADLLAHGEALLERPEDFDPAEAAALSRRIDAMSVPIGVTVDGDGTVRVQVATRGQILEAARADNEFLSTVEMVCRVAG